MPSNPKLAALRAKIAAKSLRQAGQLTADEQRRFDKLTGLLAKLKAGQHVQNRDLQTWLTAGCLPEMGSVSAISCAAKFRTQLESFWLVNLHLYPCDV